MYHGAGLTCAWTQPLTTAIDCCGQPSGSAIEAGDLYYACYSHRITSLSSPPDAQRLGSTSWPTNAERAGLRPEAGFRDVRGSSCVGPQRFIAACGV